MTAQISAYGRLVADPNTRTTGKGTNMAMARLAVSLPCNAAEDGQATFWLGVLAFGKQADALARHVKGDLVSVVGNMQLNQWKAQDGTQNESPQVIADSIISARTARPSGSKTSQDKATPPAAGNGETPPPHGQSEYDQRPPLDDETPF
ncbi:single-stranded DNA-binding protein [Escherichia coli]|nr:single-stranded DNA-binding protein [Escherichia coli]